MHAIEMIVKFRFVLYSEFRFSDFIEECGNRFEWVLLFWFLFLSGFLGDFYAIWGDSMGMLLDGLQHV